MRRSVLDRCLSVGYAVTKDYCYVLRRYENGLRYVLRCRTEDYLRNPFDDSGVLCVWSEYFPVGGDDCGSSR